MNIFSWLQLIFYMVVLIALAKPLGLYMTRVYQGEHTFLDPVLRPVEKLIYRLSGVHPGEEMNWKVYAFAMLLFNGLGLLAVYAFQRLQGFQILPSIRIGCVTLNGENSDNSRTVANRCEHQRGGGGINIMK